MWLALGLLLNASEAAPARLAVVVSNNEGLATDEPLHYADEDGQSVADVLVSLGGYAPGDVWVVPAATVDTVTAALGEMVLRASRLRDGGEAPDLLVYYTGHAGADGLHLDGEVLPLTALKTAARVVPATERVFVVDACQSGQLLRSKGATLVQVDDAPEGFQPPQDEAWFTSSGPEERSFEVDRRRGALFTHFFVSGARGAADANGDRLVTLGELYGFVHQQTTAVAAGLGYVQQPRWAGTLTALQLTDLHQAASGLVAVGPVNEALLVVRRDTAAVAAEIPPGAGARIALEPGRYQVLGVAGRVRVADIVVPATGWVQLDARSDLVEVAGVRTQGGLVQARPWSVSLGWAGGLGGTPAAVAMQGGWVGAWRAVGRGHDVGVVGSLARGRFTSAWSAGEERRLEGQLRWRYDVLVGAARLGPGAQLGVGRLEQTASRTAEGAWGAWYGSASAPMHAVAPTGSVAGAWSFGAPAGPVQLDGWLSVGGSATFGAPPTTRPMVAGSLGVEVPL